jgi:hypothetical protein
MREAECGQEQPDEATTTKREHDNVSTRLAKWKLRNFLHG